MGNVIELLGNTSKGEHLRDVILIELTLHHNHSMIFLNEANHREHSMHIAYHILQNTCNLKPKASDKCSHE
jgi:hypothetical protein